MTDKLLTCITPIGISKITPAIHFWTHADLNDKQRDFAREVADLWGKFWSKGVALESAVYFTFHPTVTNLDDCVDMEIEFVGQHESTYHWNMIDSYMGDEVQKQNLAFHVCILIRQIEAEIIEKGRAVSLVMFPPRPVEYENEA